jgi:hypothetical protein
VYEATCKAAGIAVDDALVSKMTQNRDRKLKEVNAARGFKIIGSFDANSILSETEGASALEQVEAAIAEAVEMEGDMEVFPAHLASISCLQKKKKSLITASRSVGSGWLDGQGANSCTFCGEGRRDQGL